MHQQNNDSVPTNEDTPKVKRCQNKTRCTLRDGTTDVAIVDL
jgi:hypothetical protein